MAETTAISWCDSTFNPWIGCTKVGPGCDNCYAEAQDKRFGGAHWGVGIERKRTTPAHWRNLRKWNAKASMFIFEHGHKQRVFIASQADVFDNAVADEWRSDLWAEIEACPDLEIIIVTKRVGNVERMAPSEGFPTNVILLATVCNQDEADRDLPKLLALKAGGIVSRVGVSMEPLLGAIDLTPVADETYQILSEWYGPDGFDETGSQPRRTRRKGWFPRLDWVIVGGESGPNARPSHPDWFRSLRDQCAAAGVPFFFKQWGEWASVSEVEGAGHHVAFSDGATVRRVGKRAAGSLLDGREHKAFPEFNTGVV